MSHVEKELLAAAREFLAATSANMEYDSKLKDIRQKLRQLDKQLLKHEARQGAKSESWAFVEDLVEVEKKLDDLMRFLG